MAKTITAEHQNMVNYYNWLVEVEQSEENIMYPDSTQLQQLWDIMDAGSSNTGVYARNILVALGKTTYTEPIIVPNLYKSTQAEASFNELLNTKAPNIIKVFPNPASGYIIIEYKLETEHPATLILLIQVVYPLKHLIPLLARICNACQLTSLNLVLYQLIVI